MSELKLSVIIPVYNTQKYLIQCLNSVLGQSFTDIEIILVNDGSTDNSEAICEKFKSQDRRIILVNQANKGLEEARRSGLKIAKGEWIVHVDSDDWLPANALELLYEDALSHNADIVVGKYTRVLDKYGLIKKQENQSSNLENKLVKQEEFMKNYYNSFFGVTGFSVSMWAKIYRKSFLDQIEIPLLGDFLGEDLNYNVHVFPKADIIFFSSKMVYYYRFGGMTSRFAKHLMDAALRQYDLKMKMIDLYEKPEYNAYVLIELKNYLLSYIKQIIIYNPFSKEKAFAKVRTYLNTDAMKEVKSFYIEEKDNLYIKSIVEGDLETMFHEVKKIVKKDRLNRFLKTVFSRLLN
jgi:glycosyltransferase involved in cell wall biosynthesis